MKTGRRLSWIPIAAAAGGLVAQLDGALYLTALTACLLVGVWMADRNGRTGRHDREPISHVRPVLHPPTGFHVDSLIPPEPVDQIPAPPPPAPRLTTVVEDALHIASFNEYRRRLDTNLDELGRTLKVGVDAHSSLCWDGHRLTCVCGMPDIGEVSA